MKITSFNPYIITSAPDEVIGLFEALGFERRHMKENINDEDIDCVRMKDANGYHVDVTRVDRVPRDLMAIRMNVDDFDEGYEFLTSRGFTVAPGSQITDTGSSRAVILLSPSGFGINLVKHIRKEDR